MYLDNPESCIKVFPLCFTSLGHLLFVGDRGLRLDLFHAYQRLRDTFITSTHPAGQEAIQDLSNMWVPGGAALQQRVASAELRDFLLLASCSRFGAAVSWFGLRRELQVKLPAMNLGTCSCLLNAQAACPARPRPGRLPAAVPRPQ